MIRKYTPNELLKFKKEIGIKPRRILLLEVKLYNNKYNIWKPLERYFVLINRIMNEFNR